MTRAGYIEKCLRQIYGGYIPDDSEITFQLANKWLSEGTAIAAKQCYVDSSKVEAVGYVNNGFYTTFKGLSVIQNENFLWKITLPQIPVGIGKNEGVASLKFKSSNNQVSLDCVPLSMNERSIYQGQRRIPNKTLYYEEGIYLYAISTLILSEYTASVTIVSGGDASDLSSVINVPDDYFLLICDYMKSQLGFERAQPKDISNDGSDNK